MKKMAGLKFQAQRAAFSVAADAVLKYVNKNDDRTKALLKVVDLTESFAKDRFKPESYEAARKMIQDPENKWMQYLNRLFDDFWKISRQKRIRRRPATRREAICTSIHNRACRAAFLQTIAYSAGKEARYEKAQG